jgi:uncharacterized membrane protein
MSTKFIAPAWDRIRHNRPHALRAHPGDTGDDLTFGQRVAERVATGYGSWAFFWGQAAFLAAWFLLNSLSSLPHWDPFPWLLANIVMSAEAAFTGCILLISANVASIRDHRQYDRMEAMEKTLLAEMADIRARLAPDAPSPMPPRDAKGRFLKRTPEKEAAA